MAEFKDVIENIRRMHKACACEAGGCPLYGYQFNCDDLVIFDFEIADIERVVMKWAAENPEPVYPIWGEWLMSIGVISGLFPNGAIDALGNLKQPIPADIAEKLGIEPKEG